MFLMEVFMTKKEVQQGKMDGELKMANQWMF